MIENKSKLLFLGASGLLGKNLVPFLQNSFEVLTPTHKEYDIQQKLGKIDCDLIINSIAYTKVELAETNRRSCFDINVSGVLNLLDIYSDTPFVYISSEYAHNPVNFYSLTKSLAEQLVTTHPNYLIIRTLFKPYPWPWPKAFIDQHTMGDYVDVIAPLIEKAIQGWDRKSKMIYIGTGRKTMYELASRSKLDVEPNSIKDMKVKLPSDYK